MGGAIGTEHLVDDKRAPVTPGNCPSPIEALETLKADRILLYNWPDLTRARVGIKEINQILSIGSNSYGVQKSHFAKALYGSNTVLLPNSSTLILVQIVLAESVLGPDFSRPEVQSSSRGGGGGGPSGKEVFRRSGLFR